MAVFLTSDSRNYPTAFTSGGGVVHETKHLRLIEERGEKWHESVPSTFKIQVVKTGKIIKTVICYDGGQGYGNLNPSLEKEKLLKEIEILEAGFY